MNEPGKRIQIIIPAYNEQDSIGEVVEELRGVLPSAGILVVDDASWDRTAEKAAACGAAVVRHPFNLGYGAALQTGFKYASEHDCDVVVQFDADGQHDPRSIEKLLDPVERGEADVVVGSRVLAPGRGIGGGPLKAVGSKLLAWVASAVMGQKVSDTTSGLRALNARAARLCTKDIYPTDYPDADALIMLRREGMRLAEVPVPGRAARRPSTLHSGLSPLYYAYRMSLSILATILRGRKAKK